MEAIKYICQKLDGKLKENDFCFISGRTAINILKENNQTIIELFNHVNGNKIVLKTNDLILLRIFSHNGYIETLLSKDTKTMINGEYLSMYLAIAKVGAVKILAIFDGAIEPTDIYKETTPYII